MVTNRIFTNLYTKLALFLVLITSFIFTNAQTKRGFIVAIGDYPEDTDWRDISSENDIPLIRSALQKQGFTSDKIKVLKNAEATKENIVKGLTVLSKECTKGDIVVIHFSSHGQQIEDNNNDEIDGYDEAIVAYGAPAKYDPNYDFSKHLRDDELESLLQAIRFKIGPTGDLVVFADACHSGTVGRNGAISRGGQPAYKRPGYNPNQTKQDVGMYQSSKSTIDASQLSPIVVISASLASQVNYEYEGAGSLSTAISRSADKLNSGMSYRAFFAQILKEMSILAPSQKPAIEGDIDRLLFGGKVIDQDPYYRAYKLRDNQVYLYGGKLNGIFDGTKIAVFPIGTTSIKNKVPITEGSTIFSEGTWCKVKLDKTLPGSIDDYWFFVTEQNFGELSLNIKVDLDRFDNKDVLLASLSNSPLFNVCDTATDFILEDGGRGTIDIIRASDGSVFAENISSEENFVNVIDALTSFSRGIYMKNLELTDSRYQVTLNLIPVRFDSEGRITDTLSIEDISINGTIVFSETVGALVQVINHGDQDAYFSVIDIQPDGKINGILPAEDPTLNQNPEDFFIGAGQSVIVDGSLVTFSEPYGIEVFKLFASKEPIDFTPIITKKPRTRSYISPLEALFETGYEESTRGGTTSKIKSSGMEASTSSFTFEIKQ